MTLELKHLRRRATLHDCGNNHAMLLGGQGGSGSGLPARLLLLLLRRALLQARLVAPRLRGADEAVAVGVEQPELLLAAQELARREVAVAVAVHLDEPRRRRRGLALPHHHRA